MKTITLIITVISQTAFASGTLSLEPSYDAERGRSHYSLGLGVYEELSKVYAYNSWTGFGNSVDEDSLYHSWIVSKHQIDVKPLEKLTVSPGLRVNYLDDQETDYKKRLFLEGFLKVNYKLW